MNKKLTVICTYILFMCISSTNGMDPDFEDPDHCLWIERMKYNGHLYGIGGYQKEEKKCECFCLTKEGSDNWQDKLGGNQGWFIGDDASCSCHARCLDNGYVDSICFEEEIKNAKGQDLKKTTKSQDTTKNSGEFPCSIF